MTEEESDKLFDRGTWMLILGFVALLAVSALFGCAERKIKVQWIPIEAPICHPIVDSYYKDFRRPSPPDMVRIMACIRLLREGYTRD